MNAPTCRSWLILAVIAAMAGLAAGQDGADAGQADTAPADQAAPADDASASAGASDAEAARPVDIESARQALQEWQENERLIARQKQHLQESRELLSNRIDLVRQEVAALRQQTEQKRKQLGGEDEELEKLEQRNQTLKDAEQLLAKRLAVLEADVKALSERLPETATSKVLPTLRSIPDDPEQTKLTLARRLGNVLLVLMEANKFNNTIVETSEMREQADGPRLNVTTLYLGLGQAYYVGRDGRNAGVGVPGEDGWVWTPTDEAAAEVAKAIAIMRDEQPATYVKLPAQIK